MFFFYIESLNNKIKLYWKEHCGWTTDLSHATIYSIEELQAMPTFVINCVTLKPQQFEIKLGRVL